MNIAVTAALAGAIVGGLISGISTYFVSIKMGKRNMYNTAAEDFRFSFKDGLKELYRQKKDVHTIFNDDVTKPIEDSAFRVWSYLHYDSRKQFDELLGKFYDFVGGASGEYEMNPGSIDARKRNSEKVREMINELIDYAGPK
jgi:uncharacterized protein (DUF2164 family)